MKHKQFAFLSVVLLAVATVSHAEPDLRLSRETLRDKIRGAWAGQMVGVAYGAPTEFRFLGKIIDGPIHGEPLTNAIDQDDLYVEMTFAQVMDTVGLEATSAQYGEAFQKSLYQLWHANAGARRNLSRGIAAPLSGHPKYNIHAEDIDFQIEADFIGIMCPGLPRSAGEFCDRVGRVMNYGDGLYGGMFVSGMYAAAYFEDDPRKVVEAGLACIPAESPYARLIRDMLVSSAAEPEDWRKVWRQVEDKWDKHDCCPDGVHSPFNIDAKLNGGYIALGLLYGRGDWQQTLQIATRCGQDSDCNPSNALGILGTMRGYSRLPEHDREELAKLADTKFRHTDYSLNDIVDSSEKRALEVIRRNGGTVSEVEVVIPLQTPQPPQLELSNFGVPVQVIAAGDPAWEWQGNWSESQVDSWGEKFVVRQTAEAGCAVTLTFDGTGISLVGDLSDRGGRADVFIDGVKSDLVADAYAAPITHDNDLWHLFGLSPGEHTLRLVMREDADPHSAGHQVSINRAVVYRVE